MVTRRKVLAAVGATTTLSLSGCLSNPFLNAESKGCGHGRLHEKSDCTVEVANNGPGREIRVRYEVVDFDEKILDEDSEVIYLERGEAQEVVLTVDFPSTAAASGAFAEWA